jgi:dTDP-4-amino-4,6-dideoxygalactose transaminase
MAQLEQKNIIPRRYFYPSLNDLPFLKEHVHCPVSESISKRILCLPLSTYLTTDDLKIICDTVNENLAD